MSAYRRSCIAGFWMICMFATTAFAGPIPVADGKYDPGEGYTDLFDVVFTLEGGGPPQAGGSVWLRRTDTSLFFALILPRNLVDNSYGTTSIGWGSLAGSGKHHNFKDLVGSDDASFTFRLGTDVVSSFRLDYFAGGLDTTSGYGATQLDPKSDKKKGKKKGKKGKKGKQTEKAAEGAPSVGVLSFGSSLGYNFNTLGYDSFTENSPETSKDADGNYIYGDPASAPGWIFDVIYEFEFDISLLGTHPGPPLVDLVHASPNKLGDNKVYIELFPTPTHAPEPGTLVLCGLAAVALWFRRWRR